MTDWASYQKEVDFLFFYHGLCSRLLFQIYSKLQPPAFSTDVKLWEAHAKANVPLKNFNYVYGAANQYSTYNENLRAFERYRLVPNVLKYVLCRYYIAY
jgi:hypothetical protein